MSIDFNNKNILQANKDKDQGLGPASVNTLHGSEGGRVMDFGDEYKNTKEIIDLSPTQFEEYNEETDDSVGSENQQEEKGM